MILALLLIALLQDGPVRTAPEPPPQESATPHADPGPACTFGGRPVRGPGCLTPEGRPTLSVALPEPQPEEPALVRVEECRVPANRRPSETEFECASRFRTDAWMRSVRGDRSGEIDWDLGAAVGRAPALPPVRTSEDCKVAANRGPAETEFDCALRLARQSGEPVGSLGFRVAPDGSDIPASAFDDPAAWEAGQCGAEGNDACRRQARNRLAMARAGLASEPPAGGGGAAAPENCRMVMRRAEDGFGGSLSRVCGDEGESAAALERLRETMRPAIEPCDRPASLESQDAWIARCRALPAR